MRTVHWACFVRLAVEGVGFAVSGFPLYVRAVVSERNARDGPSFSVCRLRRCVRVMNSKFVTPHELKCDIFSIRNTRADAWCSMVPQARARWRKSALHCEGACGQSTAGFALRKGMQNRGKAQRRKKRAEPRKARAEGKQEKHAEPRKGRMREKAARIFEGKGRVWLASGIRGRAVRS